MSSATRERAGKACLNSCSLFGLTSTNANPVLPPGRARLSTSPPFHRVRNDNEHDRSCRRCGLRSIGRCWRGGDKNVEVELRQLGGHGLKTLWLFRREAMLDDDVLSFDVSEFSDAFRERPQKNRFFLRAAGMPEHANPSHPLGLLRAPRAAK